MRTQPSTKVVVKVVVNHEEQYFDLAGRPRERARLERRRQVRDEGGMSGLHRRGLDGHEAAQPAEEDGGGRPLGHRIDSGNGRALSRLTAGARAGSDQLVDNRRTLTVVRRGWSRRKL